MWYELSWVAICKIIHHWNMFLYVIITIYQAQEVLLWSPQTGSLQLSTVQPNPWTQTPIGGILQYPSKNKYFSLEERWRKDDHLSCNAFTLWYSWCNQSTHQMSEAGTLLGGGLCSWNNGYVWFAALRQEKNIGTKDQSVCLHLDRTVQDSRTAIM